MNYFRCTVGGGKGNTVTVTCAEEFAGLTITLSKTGKTYTKTCPSTAPYVVTFYGVENGTYTVSCTVDGETYSETVIVQDISCVLNYGFKWQTWVDTASQLDSSDYNSLDEVLADEKALRELFLEHACVDYMAELTSSNEDLETVINNDYCAKWINLSDYALDFLHANEVIADLMDEADKYGYGEWALMPQVPKMTSNTAPYGTVSADSTASGYEAYKAFDGDESTHWASNTQSSGSGQYIQYQLANPTKVTKFHIVFFYTSTGTITQTQKIQGSVDGTTWVDVVDAFSIELQSATNTPRDIFIKDEYKDTAFSYFKIAKVSSSSSVRFSFKEIQFYAWTPKGNVPVMTGASAPYGTASESSNHSNNPAWKAFDGDPSTNAVLLADTTTNAAHSITYKFVNPVCARRMFFSPRVSTYTCNTVSFKVQVSNDGTTFTDIYTESSYTPSEAEQKSVTFNNTEYYLYYRLWFSGGLAKTSGNYYFTYLYTVQFYGRELKVSVPTMTSNTAPYGEASIYADQGSPNSSYPAWKAFDKDISSSNMALWGGNDKTGSGTISGDAYIRYRFTNSIVPRMLGFRWGNDASKTNYIFTVKAQGSNDGILWEDLSSDIEQSMTADMKYYALSNTNNAYKYMQLSYIAYNMPTGIACPQASEIQFYGLDYSEKEFEAGTTKKWLYDHGVELVPFDYTCRNSTSFEATNDGKQLLSNVNSNSSSANFVAIVPNEAIDLTDYNYLFGAVGDKLSSTMIFRVFASKPNAAGTGLATATYSVPLTHPNKMSIDVSAINQQAFPSIYNDNNGYISTCKELWLE